MDCKGNVKREVEPLSIVRREGFCCFLVRISNHLRGKQLALITCAITEVP